MSPGKKPCYMPPAVPGQYYTQQCRSSPMAARREAVNTAMRVVRGKARRHRRYGHPGGKTAKRQLRVAMSKGGHSARA